MIISQGNVWQLEGRIVNQILLVKGLNESKNQRMTYFIEKRDQRASPDTKKIQINKV